MELRIEIISFMLNYIFRPTFYPELKRSSRVKEAMLAIIPWNNVKPVLAVINYFDYF
jgi:hypothetical protein